MKFSQGPIPGVFEITLDPRSDERGFFIRTFDVQVFELNSLKRYWVQENHSFTKKKGTIRGLHFQHPPHSETKLVRVSKGKIMDVFVDLRLSSPTFGEWNSVELSDENHKLLYIPRGFAHGFCTLTDNCDVHYKVDNFYIPESEDGILWNDPVLSISWPIQDPSISYKDSRLQTFNQFLSKYQGIRVNEVGNK